MRGMKTGGRARGVPNKLNKTIREMIVEALNHAGGVAYLERQAIENPTAFLVLIAKIMPREISAPNGTPIPLDVSTQGRVVIFRLPDNCRRCDIDSVSPSGGTALLTSVASKPSN